jgi:hypothetical protein
MRVREAAGASIRPVLFSARFPLENEKNNRATLMRVNLISVALEG